MRAGALARTLIVVTACAFVTSGCATLRKHFPPKPSAAAQAKPAAQPKRVDPKAQKDAYDEGMRLFSEEKYTEARASWKKSLQMGPESPIGRKSRENLRKVETILESLRDIKPQ